MSGLDRIEPYGEDVEAQMDRAYHGGNSDQAAQQVRDDRAREAHPELYPERKECRLSRGHLHCEVCGDCTMRLLCGSEDCKQEDGDRKLQRWHAITALYGPKGHARYCSCGQELDEGEVEVWRENRERAKRQAVEVSAFRSKEDLDDDV